MPIARINSLKGPVDIFYTLAGRAVCNSVSFRSQQPGNATANNPELVSQGREETNGAAPHGEAAEKTFVQRGACRNVLFISGMAAQGSTEFFEPLVQHLAGLRSETGLPLLQVCTFDNRGIGESSAPQWRCICKAGEAYSTILMAHDTLGLMDHLQWDRAHLIGGSLGGMIACKMAAIAPERVASLTLVCTTKHGWHMAATMLRTPVTCMKAGMSPKRRFCVVANLKANFSKPFLSERIPEAGNKTRGTIMADNTHNAICLGLTDTHKFLAEGQYSYARNGHVIAVLTHRMKKEELRRIREAHVPVLLINGRHDHVAGLMFVRRLAKALNGQLLETDAAHAGVVIESLPEILPVLETHISGHRITSDEDCRRLGDFAVRQALQLVKPVNQAGENFAPLQTHM